jgi:hypothetical protein
MTSGCDDGPSARSDRQLRLTRQGAAWKGTDGEVQVIRATRIEALRALKARPIRMDRDTHWVVYVASADKLTSRFGDTVLQAGARWKPVAIDPDRLGSAIRALQPDVLVIVTRGEGAENLMPWALAVDGRQLIIHDNGCFGAVSQLLAAMSSNPLD